MNSGLRHLDRLSFSFPGLVTLQVASLVFFQAASFAQPVTQKGAPSAASSAGSASGIAQLQGRLDRGETVFKHEPQFGYLRSVLQGLSIPSESQLLVFSKTSCQRELISPKNPRAVYFNDRAYVAFIPGSTLLEVSEVLPEEGAVFYTVDQKQTEQPRFVRREQCLECHTSSKTFSLPGYLVRSYATDGNGVVDITDGCSMVDHRTPLSERWGGWYICGAATPIIHRANLIDHSPVEKKAPDTLAIESASLSSLAELSNYPVANSDLVALLVLEHQAQMQNVLNRLHYEWKNSHKEAAESPAQIAAVDAFLRYLLFVDEAVLDTPVKGTSGFATEFESRGPQDKQGRSLRQLDLQARLFRYPCSYLIYSESFDTLPRAAKVHIYHRLGRILRGEESDLVFASIPGSTRRAIFEILLETKTDLPIDWRL